MATLFLKDQTKESLRNGLIMLSSRLCLGPSLIIQVDPHSSFVSLKSDGSLSKFGISLEIGQAKNVNKNTVTEKCIRELREQLVRLSPHGGPVSEVTLAKATNNLNCLIRHTGRSAKELFFSRDQLTSSNLYLDDHDLADLQFGACQSSHSSSARYAARHSQKPVVIPELKVGDLVYVKSDRSKAAARDSYVVLSIDIV